MQQWKERKNCKQYRVFLKNPSVGDRHAACIDKRPMPRDLDDRVFRFACRIVDLFELLNAKGGAARVVGYQLLDAGTSVGSNYEEAAAGQTKADFIAKLSISRKESRDSSPRSSRQSSGKPECHPTVAECAFVHLCILAFLHLPWKHAIEIPAEDLLLHVRSRAQLVECRRLLLVHLFVPPTRKG